MTDLSNNPFYQAPINNGNWGAPLVQMAQAGQQPATKQPVSTGQQATQPAGQVNTQGASQIGKSLGQALMKLANPPPAFGGQPQVAPQQQVGPPMNIVPQGYGYQ